MSTVDIGRQGEEYTCAYIEKQGMALLTRNYHCRGGEVDIIAREGDTVVFIEVKTRCGGGFGSGAEAVTPAKIKKIICAAQHYIMKRAPAEESFRFDVAEVDVRDGLYSINYIKNAFEV